MIKRIKVSNFYSINEEIEIDFLVQEKCVDMKNGRYVQCGDDKINKLCFLIGPNGSGKTNVLSTFIQIRSIFSGSTLKKNPIIMFIPNYYEKNNVSLEIEFTILDRNYLYHAKINISDSNEQKFKSEELKRNGKTIILRNEKEIIVTIKELCTPDIFNNISPQIGIVFFINKFFKNDEINSIYEYFGKSPFALNIPKTRYLTEFALAIKNNDDFYDLVSEIMGKIDVGISGIFLNKEKLRDKINIVLQPYGNNFDAFRNNIDTIEKELGGIQFFLHSFENIEQQAPWIAESEGTKNFFITLSKMYNAIKNSSFLVIDEIDNSLHPELIRFLIDMAVKSDNPVQLIASTHNAEIISQLYPDEVYFVEKKNGATDVYSAKDFKDIECTDNLYAKYRALRLGAYPKVERIDKEQLNGSK